MRVGIVSESFLPHVNGVTNSVLRMLEHFQRCDIDAVVLAPASRRNMPPNEYAGARVRALSSLPTPGYRQVRLCLPAERDVYQALSRECVDVVHLASPFLTGPPALRASRRWGVPVVAAYQTDLAAFVTRYGFPALSGSVWRRLRAIHGSADLTLAPSRAAVRQLTQQGIPRVALLPRGVDVDRFHPRRRSRLLRRQLAPQGEALVGYLGRLAPEKCVEDLRVLHGVPGVQLVIIGDGPRRAKLRKLLPNAVFLGFLQGDELGRAVATLDVAVHPGPHETFCQSLQEVLASGVPAVAVGAGGPLDLVEPSRNGWLYPPGDLGAMRSQVADLVGDPAKARAMGERARAGVEHRTWSLVGDELVAHYRTLTGTRGWETRVTTREAA